VKITFVLRRQPVQRRRRGPLASAAARPQQPILCSHGVGATGPVSWGAGTRLVTVAAKRYAEQTFDVGAHHSPEYGVATLCPPF
jgi:hypothetical protein